MHGHDPRTARAVCSAGQATGLPAATINCVIFKQLSVFLLDLAVVLYSVGLMYMLLFFVLLSK